MKTIATTFLTLALPAALCAQQAKLTEASLPGDKTAVSASTAAAKPAQAAEIIPVIAPGPVKAKQPAAAVKTPPAAPAAKPAAAPAVAKPSAAPAAKPAAAPAAKPAAAPAAKPAAAPAAKPAAAPAAKPAAAPAVKPAAVPAAKPAAAPASGLVVRPGAAKVQPKAQSNGGFSVGKKHTVAKGDTLWDLSGKYYKNPFMWGRIYNANYKTVANPDLINPLQELLIPDIDEVVLPYRRQEPAVASISAGTDGAADAQDEEAGAARRAAAARKAAMPEPGELLKDVDTGFLSEEMPEDQKEWSDGVRVVPDGWSEDGVITAKLKSDDDFQEEGISVSGETLEITLSRAGSVRAGDYVAIFLKGTDAFDKSGKRLGREVQPAGLAEIFSVDGYVAKARVIDATTAIFKGYIVKKK